MSGSYFKEKKALIKRALLITLPSRRKFCPISHDNFLAKKNLSSGRSSFQSLQISLLLPIRKENQYALKIAPESLTLDF